MAKERKSVESKFTSAEIVVKAVAEKVDFWCLRQLAHCSDNNSTMQWMGCV